MPFKTMVILCSLSQSLLFPFIHLLHQILTSSVSINRQGRAFLKALDTFGNYCQRPVCSLGVSQHYASIQITNLRYLSSIGRRSCERIIEEKIPLLAQVVWFHMLDFQISAEVSQSIELRNYFFLENYVTSERAVSHNVFYYQPLPITRYHISLYMLIIILNKYH